MFGLVAAACAVDDTRFAESSFLSESVVGRMLVEGTHVHLAFDGGYKLEVSAGCSAMWGDYRLADGALVIDGQLGRTVMACDDLRLGQDEWLELFLRASPSYSLDAPRLTLFDESVTMVLLDEEVADPDRPLAGRTWVVEDIIQEGTVTPVVVDDPGSLAFDDDGGLSITTPCATGSATYSIVDGWLELEDVAIAEGTCPDDELAVMVDAHMRALLVDGSLDQEIDATRLTIEHRDLGLTLTTD